MIKNVVIRRSVPSLCFLLFVSCSFAAEPTKDSLKKVKENLEAKKAVLVDVREENEWKSGHIEDAIFLPLSELRDGISAEELAERLPKDKIVYTHCASGFRSRTAADALLKHKYEDVRALKPGYDDLLEAGFKKAEDDQNR